MNGGHHSLQPGKNGDPQNVFNKKEILSYGKFTSTQLWLPGIKNAADVKGVNGGFFLLSLTNTNGKDHCRHTTGYQRTYFRTAFTKAVAVVDCRAWVA